MGWVGLEVQTRIAEMCEGFLRTKLRRCLDIGADGVGSKAIQTYDVGSEKQLEATAIAYCELHAF